VLLWRLVRLYLDSRYSFSSFLPRVRRFFLYLQPKIHKVVGGGDLTAKGLTVKAHAFTASAKEAIEANGGNCVVLSKTTHTPLPAVVEE